MVPHGQTAREEHGRHLRRRFADFGVEGLGFFDDEDAKSRMIAAQQNRRRRSAERAAEDDHIVAIGLHRAIVTSAFRVGLRAPMQWFHHFFLTWMQFILDWGYLGIFVMMAFESTALPIPAEIVMPPAAYWASQGHFNLALVIVAATAGSWAGSAASYWIAYKLGRPIVS